MRQLIISVVLRRVDTGYRQLSFACGSQDEAYSAAVILVRSAEYGHCYAVGTDWQQNVVFTVNPADVHPPAQPYACPDPPRFGGPYRALPPAVEAEAEPQAGMGWRWPPGLKR